MPAQAATGLSKGVKVGDSYVKRGKIIKTVVAVIIVLALMVFFFPPLFSTTQTRAWLDMTTTCSKQWV